MGNNGEDKLEYHLGTEVPDSSTSLYRNCVAIYEAMAKTSRFVVTVEGGERVLLWRGYLTVFLEEELGITPTRYGRFMKALREMGCLVQKEKSAGPHHEGEWVLTGPPTPQVYDYWKKKQGTRHYKMNNPINKVLPLEQKVILLEQKVERLEKELGING